MWDITVSLLIGLRHKPFNEGPLIYVFLFMSFLIGEPKCLSPGLDLELLLEAHELNFVDVFLVYLLDLLGIVMAEEVRH